MEIITILLVLFVISAILAIRSVNAEKKLDHLKKQILDKKQGSIVFFGNKTTHYKK
jgi:hypothetical protein